MSGGPDPVYVRARTALPNAADALAGQLDAVVLVGAQAIYLHTGDADFTVAEHTTDADICVASADLSDKSLLAEALEARGFSLREHPGRWINPDGIPVRDFMRFQGIPCRQQDQRERSSPHWRGEPRG